MNVCRYQIEVTYDSNVTPYLAAQEKKQRGDVPLREPVAMKIMEHIKVTGNICSDNVSTSLLGSAKVNKVKIFSRPRYMIKRVLTFVSGLQESVLVHFISQNKVKILHKVKTSQNSLHQKFPYYNEQIYIFIIFVSIFELLLKFYAQFYFILNFSNSCNGKNACGNSEGKQHLLCMKSSLLMHKHIIVRQLIYSYKTFALFTRGLFKS